MTFNWGIIGTGGIAKAFARDLDFVEDQRVLAVGSRGVDRARTFADDLKIERSYASYEELVSDPDIDAVYVATPHPDHLRSTLLALDAGKPVLCEKPFAISAAEAATMIERARSKKLMLMEAMWARFLPHMHQIRSVLAAGAIGEVVTVEADHGQWFPDDPKFRLFAPELGGGALLDLGIYPISFAHMVLGTPKTITARSEKAQTGVDATTSAIFQYESGAQAILSTTLRAATPCRAVITGTTGRIEIDRTFYAPTSYRVVLRDGGTVEHANDYQGHGLREEAIEFARCVRAGLLESPTLPLSETLQIMQSLDEIRKQIGLSYPFETNKS
ncbi:MAG: Gfo/Idh/MocA family oxidoreductase [Actinomycetes bacterium]